MLSKVSLVGNSQVNNLLNYQNRIQNDVSQSFKYSDSCAAFNSLNLLGGVNRTNLIAFGRRYSKYMSVPGFLNIQQINNGRLEEQLRTEAANRIEGKFDREPLEKINAWMITSEAEGVMKTGGLASVARQLPDAFNETYGQGEKKENLDIVMPLYVGKVIKDKSGKGFTAKLEQKADGSFVYHTAERQQINVKKVDTIKVKAYNGTRLKDEDVNVYTGHIGKTRFIFLGNDKYFNVTPKTTEPHPNNNLYKHGPYVMNKHDVDESERFAFLSKATAGLMAAAKENEGNSKYEEIPAPNGIIANDWHVAALPAETRYLAPVKAARGQMKRETADYLRNTQIVYVGHNLQYQGWGDTEHNINSKHPTGTSARILNTLFEGYTADIADNAENHEKSGIKSTLIQNKNYNMAGVGLALSDAVVMVSPNYAQEIPKTGKLGYQFRQLLGTRQEHDTFLGITNGYSKASIAPSQKVVDSLNNAFNPAKEFIVYDENSIENREKNKQAFATFITDTVEKYREGKAQIQGVSLYKPENCSLDGIDDISKVPIITAVGRFVSQKGFDIMADSLKQVYNKIDDPKKMPVTIILGSGGNAADLRKMKDDLAETNPEAAKKILLFEGFSKPFGELITMCGDLFPMPSKFEPCGLTQMEAMAKGNIPVATATGGLVDTIEDGKDGFLTQVFYAQDPEQKNPSGADIELIYDKTSGGSKPKDNTEAFTQAMERALDKFHNDHDGFIEMSKNALRKDFSWEVSGGSLEKYHNLLKFGKLNHNESYSLDKAAE